MRAPRLIFLAGPNGAGKTTQARQILAPDQVGTYLNLDLLAGGLNMFAPAALLRRAGKALHDRFLELLEAREDFGFETNLVAGRWMKARIEAALGAGYELHVRFLGLRLVKHAQVRVARRVCLGGHDIPSEMIRERFNVGLAEFFGRFQGQAASWKFFESLEVAGWTAIQRGESTFCLVAEGGQGREAQVFAPEAWDYFRALGAEASHAR